MFTRQKQEASKLEAAIDAVFDRMSGLQQDSDEYAKLVDQLSKLYKLKEIDSKKRVSPDTVATVGANIVGILLILNYERLNVVATKAIGFVAKLK